MGCPMGPEPFEWLGHFSMCICVYTENPPSLPPFTPWGKKKKMAKMSPQHNIPGLANMLARQCSGM
jgi:hypothetical protein